MRCQQLYFNDLKVLCVIDILILTIKIVLIIWPLEYIVFVELTVASNFGWFRYVYRYLFKR